MENYSIGDFEAIVREALLKCGVDLDVPVRINSRISRALGRCCFRPGDGGTYVHLELSRRFVEQAPFEEIRQVLLHEAAHLVEILYAGHKTGHDETFRMICAYLGCGDDASCINTTMHMKYEARCPRCGNLCYSASRKTKKWDWLKTGTMACADCQLLSDQWTYKVS